MCTKKPNPLQTVRYNNCILLSQWRMLAQSTSHCQSTDRQKPPNISFYKAYKLIYMYILEVCNHQRASPLSNTSYSRNSLPQRGIVKFCITYVVTETVFMLPEIFCVKWGRVLVKLLSRRPRRACPPLKAW